MAAQQRRRRAVTITVGAVATLLLVAGFVEFVHKMLSLKSSKPERQVQTIQLIRPPPPPPDQPPPPPPEKVEQQIQQDKPEPTPDEPQEQAPDLLANDGPASAGGDAFGMHQGSGGILGGSGTAPFAWYTNRVRDEIKDKLNNSSCIKSTKGSVNTRVVIAADGRIKHIELTSTTGNARTDECLGRTLASITRVGADPPPGMPESVNLRVVF